MRTPPSALPLMANPFVRTAGQLMFAWSLVGKELETLTSHDKLKLGGKNLEVYPMLVQHAVRDNSGLSLARRKDATFFLRCNVRDDGQHHPSMSTESDGKQDYGKENLLGHPECIPEYWNRKRGWFLAISREPWRAGRDTKVL